MKPSDSAESDEAIRARDDDAIQGEAGAGKSQRYHPLFGGCRRSTVVRRHRHGAIGDDETAAIDANARAVPGDRQHAALDPAIEGVVGDHGRGSGAGVSGKTGSRRGSPSNQDPAPASISDTTFEKYDRKVISVASMAARPTASRQSVRNVMIIVGGGDGRTR